MFVCVCVNEIDWQENNFIIKSISLGNARGYFSQIKKVLFKYLLKSIVTSRCIYNAINVD